MWKAPLAFLILLFSNVLLGSEEIGILYKLFHKSQESAPEIKKNQENFEVKEKSQPAKKVVKKIAKPITKKIPVKKAGTKIKRAKFNKPEVVKPEVVKPEVVKPEIVKPEIVKPEIVKPEIVQLEKKTINQNAKIIKAQPLESKKETVPIKNNNFIWVLFFLLLPLILYVFFRLLQFIQGKWLWIFIDKIFYNRQYDLWNKYLELKKLMGDIPELFDRNEPPDPEKSKRKADNRNLPDKAKKKTTKPNLRILPGEET